MEISINVYIIYIINTNEVLTKTKQNKSKTTTETKEENIIYCIL